mmetsp:Transcript_27495/g.40615  ORF Transcript_27495/g.40615 Transcript_27495/m.40615 type:complete len:219 (+) Transcript_27495:64-720(+)|eukprot:CAMPEP_0194200538 /NCGR_PEP_ID=MMETSP0156-20130528/1098_1 /TAXON_ID=33649 /ORGANISM="Thalassionema nitzschioides, Strain L26-B" /LENGTH=218 /DNA_ID=CAMNT_0038925545 /DNA_START=63 /DNA_END=719 /DNA_ORIENTATION=+
MTKMRSKFILSPIIAIAMLAFFGVQFNTWITRDTSVTSPPPKPEYALHRATKESNFKKVGALIEKGFSVNREDEKGITPFIEAVLKGDKPLVVLMLRHGALAQPKLGFRHTPLRAACLTGNVDLIKMLLIKGADPNAKSEGDRTPLMGACFLRPDYSDDLSLPAVQAMLEDPRTNPLIANSFNETALDLCKQRNYTESVKLLEGAVAESTQKALPLFQ